MANKRRHENDKDKSYENRRLGLIDMSLRHPFLKHCIAGTAGCLWWTQIRACGALCLPVIEAEYTTVQKQGDMTYIFLPSPPQTLSLLLSLPHTHYAAKAHFTKLTCPFFLLMCHVLRKWFQSPILT